MNKKVKTTCWTFGSFTLCRLCALMCLCGCKEEYNAPDLQTYNLRGHVKSVDINAYNLGEEVVKVIC